MTLDIPNYSEYLLNNLNKNIEVSIKKFEPFEINGIERVRGGVEEGGHQSQTIGIIQLI